MADIAVFGVQLRSCRESAGLSQEQLAERTSLSIRAIRDLERGRTARPHPGTLRRLADAFALQGQARVDFLAAGRAGVARHPAGALASEPGAELRYVHPSAPRRELDQPAAVPTRPAAAPTAPPVVPAQLPPAVADFSGRSRELESADRADFSGPFSRPVSNRKAPSSQKRLDRSAQSEFPGSEPVPRLG